MCALCERPWLGIWSRSRYSNRHAYLGGRYPHRGFNPYWDHRMKRFQRGVTYDEKKDSRRYNLFEDFDFVEKRWNRYD